MGVEPESQGSEASPGDAARAAELRHEGVDDQPAGVGLDSLPRSERVRFPPIRRTPGPASRRVRPRETFGMIPGSEIHSLPIEDQDLPLVPFEEWAPHEPEITRVFADFMNRHAG